MSDENKIPELPTDPQKEVKDETPQLPTSDRINAVGNLIVSVLKALNKVTFPRVAFYTFVVYVGLIMWYYKPEIVNMFSDKTEYVKLKDLGCVSDILYTTQSNNDLYGIEVYLFQPNGHDKEYAERLFSKCEHVIQTPKKIAIINMIDTYNGILGNPVFLKDGNGNGDVFDFALNSSNENEIAYIFRISASDGGIYGMMVVYSKEILTNEMSVKLQSVAKYIFTFCN